MCFTGTNISGSDYSKNTTALHWSCLSCPTYVYLGCSASAYVSHCFSMEGFCIIICVSLVLTWGGGGGAQLGSRCYTSAQLAGWVSFQLFYCVSLAWLCGVSGVILPLTVNDFASSRISHCHSLGWVLAVTNVLVLLFWIALNGPRWLTAAHFGGSVLFQMSHCHLPGSPCHLRCSTAAYEVAFCCPRCPTEVHCGFCISSQVSHHCQ